MLTFNEDVDLSPNAGFLLSEDRDDDLAHLLEQYPDEGSAAWVYTKALLAFRQHGDTPEASTVPPLFIAPVIPVVDCFGVVLVPRRAGPAHPDRFAGRIRSSFIGPRLVDRRPRPELDEHELS